MKIILATSGGGGHFVPALKVACELRKNGHEVIFIGSLGRALNILEENGFGFANISARGFFSNNFKENLKSSFSMVKSCWASLKILKKVHPAVVVGFGGYGAFPVVLAAILLRQRTLIHEQNVVPGQANALLANFVNKVAISFQQSHLFFKNKDIVWTGCPSQFEQYSFNKAEILKEFQLESNRKTILVVGGSQGSHRINQEFIAAIEMLKGELSLQVIHISGQADYEDLSRRYKNSELPFVLFEFLSDMNKAYNVADLIIARAGAVTVTEIAEFNKPAILIPYPYARGHQRNNALTLVELNLAVLIEEKSLSALRLKEEIKRSLKKEFSLERSQKNSIFVPNATQRLAEEIYNLAV